MKKLTKVVNIYPSMPITSINPPIRTVVKRVTKSVDEIRTCLMARAVVDEILSDGNIVRLNISNYDKLLDESGVKVCGCGLCDSCKPEDKNEEKTPWQIAYDNVIGGKNLAILPRKQRRALEAAAKAAADAAVAKSEPEVVMGVASVETVEEVETAPAKEVAVEEKVEIEETVEVQEEVKTEDIEKSI